MKLNGDCTIEKYLKSLTFLCVEDSDVIQFLYESILQDKVKKIIFSYDGEDGYNRFMNEPVDIIITDYQMPRLNGIEMIEKIRATDTKIPIILVTAIEEIDVVVKALQLNVNNLLKKPINSDTVMHAVENISKILLAEKILEEKKEEKLKLLNERNEYVSYQEELAFAKELNILRNDFYYQMLDVENSAFIDFFYKPLNTLSGDAYSARRVDKNRIFCLVVDGMGKGLSASLSAMLLTTFINHLIDTIAFDMHEIIERSIRYIGPILLDEEAISVDFILLDCSINAMTYAKFSMPASLVQTDDNQVVKIKSNNPSLSKYTQDFTISVYDTQKVVKFLFFSDGIVENSTKDGENLYLDSIENDFLTSLTKEEMKNKFLETIGEQEDDITFIFIHKLKIQNNTIATKNFPSTMSEVENANEWYNEIWTSLTNQETLIASAGVVFTELLMNAYEHGNLGLDAQSKQCCLEEDTYFDTLENLEKECTKIITVSIYKIDYSENAYILTSIADEGDGFDTNMLSQIFRNSKIFHGRSVFVSRRSSLGIYYNQKGNVVLYLHKL